MTHSTITYLHLGKPQFPEKKRLDTSHLPTLWYTCCIEYISPWTWIKLATCKGIHLCLYKYY